MQQKRGLMVDVLVYAIVGLLIIGIIAAWSFGLLEEEELDDYVACKASVVSRYTAVEKAGGIIGEIGGNFAEDFAFSTACRTNKVTIDYNASGTALEQIGEEIVACHNLYGEGIHKLYGTDVFDGELYCFICSRITFEKGTEHFYVEENNLNVGNYLLAKKGEFDGNIISYYEYLYEIPRKKLLSQDEFEEQKNSFQKTVLEASNFSSDEGDIYVVYTYSEGGKVGDFFETVLDWINPFSESVSTTHSGGVSFIQPENDKYGGVDPIVSNCDVIETIP